MNRIIFYSWQSDLPNASNWGFIEKALENTAKEVRRDETIVVEPVVERDTRGVPGAPDIVETIFQKIADADIFVCDVSIINRGEEGRCTPNPNVLVELGYALSTMGESRVVLVMNTFFGGPEKLPFDLPWRRVITYNMNPESSERAPVRRELEGKLKAAIDTILKKDFGVIPGLSQIDGMVLKLVGDNALKGNDTQVLYTRDILPATRELDMPDDEVRDSIRVLNDDGYLKIFGRASLVDDMWEDGAFSLEFRGFDAYVQARVRNYDALFRGLAERILRKEKDEEMTADTLAREFSQPSVLIEHVLERLKRSNAIKTVAAMGMPVSVFQVLPQLRRLLQNE